MIQRPETVGSIEFKSNNGNEELASPLPAAGSAGGRKNFSEKLLTMKLLTPDFVDNVPRKSSRQKGGFTLIELLVVIAIMPFWPPCFYLFWQRPRSRRRASPALAI
jgi:prepilin-type N-terminal cleavage/methylation domain-containing protein